VDWENPVEFVRMNGSFSS